MTIQDFKTGASRVFTTLRQEIQNVRTNRPNPGVIEDVKVNYYEQMVPLKSIASVSVLPPRELTVQAWDINALPHIVKAIETVGMGMSASINGSIVRVHLPELSSERREELVKYVKKMIEEHRIELRHLRDEAIKKLQRLCDDGEVREDEKFKTKEDIQKELDRVNKEIESLLEAKIKEIHE